jgi:hypothetical protein
MGDWTDEFGWYDDLDRQEQEEERKARRAKLLTPPEPAQKPMHPELRKMWEDYFDKCFREFSAAQPAQEPVNLLEARKIAAEYGTPDSQVDNGNLYFALSKCLEHIDAQPAPVREDWGPGPHEVHSLPPAAQQEHEPENEPYVSLASVQERTDYAVHLNHCNIGECEGVCKYLDDDCPALKHADMKAKWDRPTPPAAQRQWVGLTDEEVYPFANEHLHYQTEGYEVSGVYNLARAIEAKLKEKNT